MALELEELKHVHDFLTYITRTAKTDGLYERACTMKRRIEYEIKLASENKDKTTTEQQ